MDDGGRHPGLRVVDAGVVLTLHVQPGARRSGFVGRHGDALKVKVASPPLDGRANRAVIDLVSETFDLHASAITLLTGASSRQKRLLLAGLDAERATRTVDRILR